jgi:hypothetical protein
VSLSVRFILTVVVSLLLSGCGEKDGGQKQRESASTTGAGGPATKVSYTRDSGRALERRDFASPADLGRAVVEGLNANDPEALYRLLVSKQEYTGELWPAFPASDPKFNFTPEFAWSNLYKKCVIGIEKRTARHGGKNLSFSGIRFDRPTEAYNGFRLHRGTVLTVRNPDGKEGELKFLGSVVEKGGRYRLLSYDD